jgi:hypothetical protein
MGIVWVWRLFKKRRGVDPDVEERLSHIPEAQAARIKRRLQEHRERQLAGEK